MANDTSNLSKSHHTYLSNLPSKEALTSTYLHTPISQLRTPAFVVDRAIVRRNCTRMLRAAGKSRMSFRAHVKTHKTTEGTRFQLSPTTDGADEDQLPLRSHAIIVSTLMEAWEVLRSGLVDDGTVNDILYGLPVSVTKIPEIHSLRTQLAVKGATLRLIVDHPAQVDGLNAFTREQKDGGYMNDEKTPSQQMEWSVFVKVDPGYNFLMTHLLASSSTISVYGFYCHAGHSYSSTSLPEATTYFTTEVDTVIEAVRITNSLRSSTPPPNPILYVLSVGSTPTAHASAAFKASEVPGTLELHAGNYIFHDLQQLATSLIESRDIAFRVIASVVSLYPGRGAEGVDEAMVDVGGLGMSKDVGPIKGWGKVVGVLKDGPSSMAVADWLMNENTGWTLSRISQEHGILSNDLTSLMGKSGVSDSNPSMRLNVGDKVAIIGQHACLVAASQLWYYVVDSDVPGVDGESVGEKVVDVWVPWKGW
ncbi:hypothetical protein FRB98_003841 [Tulasnella sp. 332]|nr:hypothetical protein FRB98_003841 [Tulasnella sp. 332]